MIHELKTVNPYFSDVWAGRKKAEVRLDDRNYLNHDYLLLKEFDYESQAYTGRYVKVMVTNILFGGQYGIVEGYVMMSFEIHKREDCMKNIFSKYLQWIENAGVGATRKNFIEDWEPIGGSILHGMLIDGLIEIDENGNISIKQP